VSGTEGYVFVLVSAVASPFWGSAVEGAF